LSYTTLLYRNPQHDRIGMLAELAAEVQWDVPVQPLESAAAAARESASHMHAQGDETSSTLSHSLFSSLEILRQGTLSRWDAKRECWQRCHCVLTRSGFLHTCAGTAAGACKPLESVALVKYEFDGADKDEVTFYVMRRRDGWFGTRGPRRAFRAQMPRLASEWMADIRGQMAIWDGRTPVRASR
jgi:hypothetical protein